VTGATVNNVAADGFDNEAPPPGTAVVRPLSHVQAVRQRYFLRFADPAEAAASRSARAWAWALGETATAPVTARLTSVPPSRSDIEAEITVADERRLRGGHENRADAAATILRWLIGDDDHVPVRDKDCGELVGGFGEVVRSPALTIQVLSVAADNRRRVVVHARRSDADPRGSRSLSQDADYLDGVIATLAWVLGHRPVTPITRTRVGEVTSRDLKAERVHAQDVIDRAGQPWMADRLLSLSYGQGAKVTITWLLGDAAAAPVDLAEDGSWNQGR
jgi:hypothetical protein